jgi:hypothetical protein
MMAVSKVSAQPDLSAVGNLVVKWRPTRAGVRGDAAITAAVAIVILAMWVHFA